MILVAEQLRKGESASHASFEEVDAKIAKAAQREHDTEARQRRSTPDRWLAADFDVTFRTVKVNASISDMGISSVVAGCAFDKIVHHNAKTQNIRRRASYRINGSRDVQKPPPPRCMEEAQARHHRSDDVPVDNRAREDKSI